MILVTSPKFSIFLKTLSIFEISLIEKRIEILKTADIVTAVQGARELFERNSKFVLILKHLPFLCACIYLTVFFYI